MAVLSAVLNVTAADAAIHRVRADGTSDRPTIQAAINVAADGDTVLLDCGVYSGLGNRDIDASPILATGGDRLCPALAEASQALLAVR